MPEVWSLDITILPLKALVQQSAIHYKYFTSVILYTYQDIYNCDPSEIYLRAYLLRSHPLKNRVGNPWKLNQLKN